MGAKCARRDVAGKLRGAGASGRPRATVINPLGASFHSSKTFHGDFLDFVLSPSA